MTVIGPPGALSSMQRAELLEVLRRHVPPIDRVDIYGSRANGTARPGSDIDIVLSGPISEGLLSDISMEFEESYVSVSVDVSAYATLRPGPFKDQVLLTARALFDRSQLVG